MRILNNLNMAGNQILNFRVQNLAGLSSGFGAAEKGRMEFDTTSGQNLMAVWSGSAWVKLRDDWVASVASASGGPVIVSGTAAVTLDISLASGSFLVGNGSNLARAVAKASIPISGFAAAAATVDLGSNRISNLADPTSIQDAATKGYVDNSTQGLFVKTASRVATTGALPAHGFSAGVITASANGALPAQDGVTLVVGNRILVKDEGSGTSLQNGIYTVTAVGDAGNPFVLTRATDSDTSAEVETGLYTLITEGSIWANTGWILTTVNPITLNTTALTFTQFTSAGQVSAGNGIVKVGSAIHFATSSAYTANSVAIATGTATMGFVSNNATATAKYLKQFSSGTPFYAQIDIAEITGSPVSGSGTSGFHAKFNGTTSVTNSIVYDDGTKVGINNSSPTYHFDLSRNLDNTVWLRMSNTSSGVNARTGFAIEGEASIGGLFIEKFSSTFSATPALQNTAFIYTTSTCDLALGTGGVERMRFHPNGNVSIGSSLDRTKLFLAAGELWVDYSLGGSTNGAAMRIGTHATASFWGSNLYFNAGSGTNRRTRAGGSSLIQFDTSATSTGGSITFNVAVNGAADADLSYATAVTMDPAGNVGVGIVPTVKFQVDGIARSGRVGLPLQYIEAFGGDASGIYLRAVSSNGSIKALAIQSLVNPSEVSLSGNAIVFQMGRSDAVSEKARIDHLGNFGLGTTTPASRMHIASPTATLADWQILTITSTTALAADAGGSIGLGGVYTGGGGVTHFAGIAGLKNNATDGDFAGYLSFRTRVSSNLVERMRITSGGLVGIGTAAPSAGFHLFGLGQTTAAMTDAGSFAGSILVQDSGASAGNGGSILFAMTNSTPKTFAAIKGLVTDGSGNGTGHLAFATRAATSDTALTERMRLDGATGAMTVFALAGTGTRIIQASSAGVVSAITNGSNGQVLTLSGGAPIWGNLPTFGTVTSVALTAPAQFAVTGSPVTSTGTLAIAWNNQTANTILSGPTSGGAALPTFRALVAADIPTHDASKISGGDLPAGVTLGSKAIARITTATISIGTTTIDISHGLATTDLIVMLRNGAGEYMMSDYTAISTAQVRVTFAQATTEALVAVIHG